MNRTIRTAADRQDQILDAAEQLFGDLGYANASIQAIIDAVGIAKGTFYHHFSSKAALLDALVRRMIDQVHELVQDLVDDPSLDALTKLHTFFDRIDAWKLSHSGLMIDLQTALTSDSNATLAKRLEEATHAAFAPIVASIVSQGVREGVFDTNYPAETARIVLHILGSLSDAFAVATSARPEETRSVASLLETANQAHTDAIERVLGAERGSVHLIDRETLLQWAAAIDARRAP